MSLLLWNKLFHGIYIFCYTILHLFCSTNLNVCLFNGLKCSLFMETVAAILYWGGNIIQDPIEGISYDLPLCAVDNISLDITLPELIQSISAKVLEYGESARVKLTCRFPIKYYPNSARYIPMPLSDEANLRLAISRVYENKSCLEIYIDKEAIVGANDNFEIGSQSFSQLLTQRTYANIEPSPPCQIPQQSGFHEYCPIEHYTQPTGDV